MSNTKYISLRKRLSRMTLHSQKYLTFFVRRLSSRKWLSAKTTSKYLETRNTRRKGNVFVSFNFHDGGPHHKPVNWFAEEINGLVSKWYGPPSWKS